MIYLIKYMYKLFNLQLRYFMSKKHIKKKLTYLNFHVENKIYLTDNKTKSPITKSLVTNFSRKI